MPNEELPMKSDGLTAVRRSDRAVRDDEWIEEMLAVAGVGVLATVEGGQPFLNSNLFVYDRARRAIYLHTARVGRTRSTLEGGCKVCFTVFEIGRLLPADTALEFSTEYAGVTVFGRGCIVEDRAEQERALQQLLDKYFADLRPGADYSAITDDELQRTSVFRVDIDDWVGKRKTVEPNFPGAREYRGKSILRKRVEL